jgi:hypothetical protein
VRDRPGVLGYDDEGLFIYGIFRIMDFLWMLGKVGNSITKLIMAASIYIQL